MARENKGQSALAIVLEVWLYVAFNVAIYGGIGSLIYFYWRDALAFVGDLFNLQDKTYGKAAIYSVFAVIVGIALYRLRTIARIHYGFLEIMFGMISVFSASSPSEGDATYIQVIQIAAGIYIIVRGLDNVTVGLDQRPNHPLRRFWDHMFPELIDDRPDDTQSKAGDRAA